MIAAPVTIFACAIWNWPAIYAPDEMPETEVASMFAPRAGSVSCATGGAEGVACRQPPPK